MAKLLQGRFSISFSNYHQLSQPLKICDDAKSYLVTIDQFCDPENDSVTPCSLCDILHFCKTVNEQIKRNLEWPVIFCCAPSKPVLSASEILIGSFLINQGRKPEEVGDAFHSSGLYDQLPTTDLARNIWDAIYCSRNHGWIWVDEDSDDEYMHYARYVPLLFIQIPQY